MSTTTRPEPIPHPPEVGLSGIRHFLADDDLTPAEQKEVLELALELKQDPFKLRPLEGPKSVSLLFSKSSTRTRFSFEAGIAAMGGHAIVATDQSSQLGKGETLQDTAAVMSRFTEMIIWRTFAHQNLIDMAETATVPIINSLTDDLHPCQILADLVTCAEEYGGVEQLKGKKAVYLGDGNNNMANSYLIGFATAGVDIAICAPADFQPEQHFVDRAQDRANQTGATITVTDSLDVVEGADIIITDTWVSMGQEKDGKDRRTPFMPYQVNEEMMAKAGADSIFLHCLPAYRGNEVTAEVIDGEQSRVFDEAENRLHAQKALMCWLLDKAAEASANNASKV
ncbi:ornithine carbamoyltransferase [Corynebacterium casei]|uniref:ornithine carbamoyltransferase n=1 Tax=Corynebacterium casei TaxID=160386 RepID=UPI003F9167C7